VTKDKQEYLVFSEAKKKRIAEEKKAQMVAQ
jgi:hypothetical protein